MKSKIAVISSSVRTGRLSHRVALFVCDLLGEHDVDLIDLRERDFPLFDERLKYMADPPAGAVDFARRVAGADGVVVVAPIYNASFPAALKNVVDLLVDEWVRKPVLVVAVSSGGNAPVQTAQQLQALFLKLGARVAAPLYTVIRAGDDFAEDGTPVDRERLSGYAREPLTEFLWLVNRTKTI
jgi:NAD(P)H-dependent FMN reductase